MTGQRLHSLAVGEFNSDGIQDLVASPGSVSCCWVMAMATFQPALKFSRLSISFYIAVGFFNGDWIQDVAILRLATSGISVLMGNGDGTFQAPLFFDTGVPLFQMPEKRSLAAGDFNGDGNQDLVATNASAASISVLLGNGDGTFRTPLIFDAGGVPVSLAVGDFNNDRIQDLAMAHHSFPASRCCWAMEMERSACHQASMWALDLMLLPWVISTSMGFTIWRWPLPTSPCCWATETARSSRP